MKRKLTNFVKMKDEKDLKMCKKKRNLGYFFEGRGRREKKCGKGGIQGASTCDCKGCGLHKSGL